MGIANLGKRTSLLHRAREGIKESHVRNSKGDAATRMSPSADLRDYLAAERTLLAWIRTGLALMGFGFVVARFGLFLQQLQISQHAPGVHTYGLSWWSGTALVAASVVVNVLSGLHPLRVIRALDGGQDDQLHSTTLVVATAFFLALVGSAMAVYLITVPSTPSLQPEEGTMTPGTAKGITDIPSKHSVDQTVDALTAILKSKGVNLFALVDHSGEAEKVGMKMRPTKLLIFGSPKAGTPLMLASPSIAIDLPLKIWVWEDTKGKVWVSYNTPEYLKSRHDLPQELLQNIAVVEKLAAQATE